MQNKITPTNDIFGGSFFAQKGQSRAPRTTQLPVSFVHYIPFEPDRHNMSIQDRTNEFKACVDSINNRSAFGKRGADSKQRLIQTRSATKGEFSRMASAIGKEISSTNIKLNKLGQCASPSFFFQQVLTMTGQWRSGRHCLTTGQLRLVYASFETCWRVLSQYKIIGTHIYH